MGFIEFSEGRGKVVERRGDGDESMTTTTRPGHQRGRRGVLIYGCGSPFSFFSIFHQVIFPLFTGKTWARIRTRQEGPLSRLGRLVGMRMSK